MFSKNHSSFYVIEIRWEKQHALLGSRDFKYHCHLVHTSTTFWTLYLLSIPRCSSHNDLVASQTIFLTSRHILDKLVRQTQNIESAIKNMNSRPRKGKEPENDEEGGD